MSVVYERDVNDMVTITQLRDENRELQEKLKDALDHLEEQRIINAHLRKELNRIADDLDDDLEW